MRADAHHPPVREHDVRAALDLVEHLRQRAEVAGRVGLERDDQRIGSAHASAELKPSRKAAPGPWFSGSRTSSTGSGPS